MSSPKLVSCRRCGVPTHTGRCRDCLAVDPEFFRERDRLIDALVRERFGPVVREYHNPPRGTDAHVPHDE